MKLVNQRITAVVAGATILVGLGAAGAVAAGKITSADIKNQTIRKIDIGPNAVGASEVKNGSLGVGDLSAKAQSALKGADGKDGLFNLKSASLSAPKLIANIGGPINDRYTDLGTKVTLEKGTYLVTVDGAFISDKAAAATDGAVDVYPQLSLWIDKDGNGKFNWKGADDNASTVADNEGDMSPNALMPTAKDRHISTTGNTIITVEKTTEIGLLGFGYTSTSGSERSGEIAVLSALLTATPIS